MKAKTGQIFHNGLIRYLLVEVRLDQEAMPEGPGRYAMVISGHRDLGRLWAFEDQEYSPTCEVVEDVGFLETGFLDTDYYAAIVGKIKMKDAAKALPPGQARAPRNQVKARPYQGAG